MEVLDVREPSFRVNPYPALKRVREAGPLCRIEPFGFTGVTRYHDVVSVLKNPKLFSSAGMEKAFTPIKGAELFTRNSVLIGSDPPNHTRVRRLVQRAFTLQEMAAWEPKVNELTRRLVSQIAHKATFDLIADLAMPLPVMVISEMLGVDGNRRLDFKRWSDDMVSVRSVQVHQDPIWREKREREIVSSCNEFRDYFEQVIAQRRRDPSGPDLISAMIRASEADQILKPEEVLSLTRLMLVAGNETTTNLLGNAMTALLANRDQWDALVANPDLAASATEEALRFDGPVLHLIRRVTEDTEIGGIPLEAETIVAPMIACSNHDPRKFENPEAFDIQRGSRDHLAFGLGIHLCVGAPLARMETMVALRELTKFPDLHVISGYESRLDALFLRGHKSLKLYRASLTDSFDPDKAVPYSKRSERDISSGRSHGSYEANKIN